MPTPEVNNPGDPVPGPNSLHHSTSGMYSNVVCELYDNAGQLLAPDTAGQMTAGRFGSGHFSISIRLAPVFGSMAVITFWVLASIENRYSPVAASSASTIAIFPEFITTLRWRPLMVISASVRSNTQSRSH